MDRNWKIEVAKSVGALGEAFSKTVTPITIRAYEIGLDGLTVAQVAQATAAALRQSKFMPTPAELRELAGEVKAADRAVVAWMAVSRAVERVGTHETIQFDDPITNATIRSLGGWIALGDLPRKEFDTFTRHRFIESYKSLAASGRCLTDEACGPLIGRYDQENLLHGYDARPIRRIVTGLPALPGTSREAIESGQRFLPTPPKTIAEALK